MLAASVARAQQRVLGDGASLKDLSQLHSASPAFPGSSRVVFLAFP